MKGGLKGLFEELKERALWVIWGNSVLGRETSQVKAVRQHCIWHCREKASGLEWSWYSKCQELRSEGARLRLFEGSVGPDEDFGNDGVDFQGSRSFVDVSGKRQEQMDEAVPGNSQA